MAAPRVDPAGGGGFSAGLAPPAPIGRSSAVSVSQLSAATRSLAVLCEDRQTTTYDLLHGRLMAWKALVNMLTAYVRAVAAAKKAAAASHRKAAELLGFPTGSGDQFKQEGGILVVFLEFQKLSRTIAADEANSSITMEVSVAKELKRLKGEIKARAKLIAGHSKSQGEKLSRDEAAQAEAIKLLAHGLDQYVLRRPDGPVPPDPWLMNHAVRRKIDSNITEQIATHNKMLAELESYVSFEASVLETLRSGIKSFAELWQSDLLMQLSMLNTAQAVAADLRGNTEYEDFAARNRGRLVQKKSGDEKEDRANLLNQVGYDNRDHPLCTTVKTGRLMKKRSLTGWKETYWVLTGTGWLHSFATSDILRHAVPGSSVFVGGSQLGAHSLQSDPNGFELVEQTHHPLLGRRRRKHRFRGVTYAEAMEWWTAIQPLASSVLDRLSSAESLDDDGDSAEDAKRPAGPDGGLWDDGRGGGGRLADTRGPDPTARAPGPCPPRIEVHGPAPAAPPVPPSPRKVEADLQASTESLHADSGGLNNHSNNDSNINKEDVVPSHASRKLTSAHEANAAPPPPPPLATNRDRPRAMPA